MLRAKWRWIHESSSGKPAAPAIWRSRIRKRASAPAATKTTTRSADARRRTTRTTRRLLPPQRIARILDRAPAEWQDVEETAVRQVDLHEPGRPFRGRVPVVDEPDESLDRRGQPDVAVRHRRHRRRQPRGVVAGGQRADAQVVDPI